MPFDAIATTALPIDSPERWSVDADRAKHPRSGFRPTDDNLALYIIGVALKGGWAKRFNDGENHCIVGWVANYCEPMTVFSLRNPSEQMQRLLKRLHDALPRSAQRMTRNPAYTLARYNDTHQHAAVVRVAERAYKMYINEAQNNARSPG